MHDHKCYALAVAFLDDEPEIDSPEAREKLADAIQDAVEECLTSLKEARDDPET